MNVEKNYHKICEEVAQIARKCGRDPKEIVVIGVTKGYSWDHVFPSYLAGCRDFGESRLPEAIVKMEQAPQNLRWHLIGTLQKNKVRKAIGRFFFIHSVDSIELAKKISECSEESVTKILLQANISKEEAKHGLSADGWKKAIESIMTLPGIEIEGLMTMAPLVNDEKIIRATFSGLRELRDELRQITGLKLPHLSMGMSHDFQYAIEEGATLLRIGTALYKTN